MSCINDDSIDNIPRRPPRPVSYANLRKFGTPEFVRSANSNGGGPRVVNSSSCRQKFLRSYTFTREDSPPPVVAHEKSSKMCFGLVRERLIERKKSRSRESVDINGDQDQDQDQDHQDYNYDFNYKRRSTYRVRMGKEVSCAAFLAWCKRTMLFCTIKVDVADRV